MGEEITRPALRSSPHVNLIAALPWEINVPILQMSILRPRKLKQGLRSHRALVAVGTGPGWETSRGVASGLTSSSALGPFQLVLCREHWAPTGPGRGGSLLWAWVSLPACDSLLPGAPLEALEGH